MAKGKGKGWAESDGWGDFVSALLGLAVQV